MDDQLLDYPEINLENSHDKNLICVSMGEASMDYRAVPESEVTKDDTLFVGGIALVYDSWIWLLRSAGDNGAAFSIPTFLIRPADIFIGGYRYTHHFMSLKYFFDANSYIFFMDVFLYKSRLLGEQLSNIVMQDPALKKKYGGAFPLLEPRSNVYKKLAYWGKYKGHSAYYNFLFLDFDNLFPRSATRDTIHFWETRFPGMSALVPFPALSQAVISHSTDGPEVCIPAAFFIGGSKTVDRLFCKFNILGYSSFPVDWTNPSTVE